MKLEQPVNPYIAGPALSTEKEFFGRQDVINQVTNDLKNTGVNVLVLFGQRRIGKTSLLYQLKRALPKNKFFSIYFDLQDQSKRPLGKVLAELAETVTESLNIEIDLNKFDSEGRYFRKEFLPQLYKALGNIRPVFLFDEFDVIDQMPKDEMSETIAAKSFFPLIRKIISESMKPAFVFAVGRQAKDLSPEFNTVLNEELNSDINATLKGSIAHEVWILDQDSAKNLILQAERNNSLQFYPEAIDRILSLTNSHPYLLQLLCQRIWQLAYEKDNWDVPIPVITKKDVEEAIHDALETGGQALNWLWDGFSPAEKIYAAAFAETASEKEILSKDSVIQIITENAPRLRTRDVERAPQYLEERHILERTGHDKYCFSIELLRLWISKNKPLNKIKDALDSIDPLADSAFNTGQEFFKRQMWKKAIGQFRNALEINPRHFRARFQLGESLLRNKQIEAAISEFEAAYNLDQNETRLALASALIILAKKELERNNYNKAIEIFNRALVVSPNEGQAQNLLAKTLEEQRKTSMPAQQTQTRPTLIIGLGGTGQQVLTLIKKNLLEINNGQIPKQTRLLCFDTSANFDIKDSSISDITTSLIDNVEFISIGTNIYDIVSSISDHQKLPQWLNIDSWLDAKEIIRRYTPAVFNLKEGAAQVRQFGRLALFNDLLQFPQSRIFAHLDRAISDIRKEAEPDQQIEIILLASSDGGTGAGMFIDMGILTRKIVSYLEKNICMRGFFITTRVDQKGDENEARSFAAWRELNRFMTIHGNYGQRVMRYNPTNQQFDIKIDRRVFDVCYFIENRNRVLNSPENVYPAIANAICALIDTKAGRTYTEYVISNMAGKLTNLPPAPYYSAIGSYSLKVPTYFSRRVYAHECALSALDILLQPIKDVDNNRIIDVSSDKNSERLGYSGDKGALEFLRARTSGDLGSDQRQFLNSPLLQIVAEIKVNNSNEDRAFIQRVSLASLQKGIGEMFWRALVNISDDARGEKLFREIENELNYSLTKEVPSSRVAGDNPSQAYPRIERKIPIVFSEHYGRILSDGSEQRGKFGSALYQCRLFQTERFQEMLSRWLDTTLNGTVEDVERAKGGKIGYAYNTLSEIMTALGYFIEFLGKVRRQRNELMPTLRVDERAITALADYRRHKDDKCWISAWDNFVHPRAHMSQIQYLRTEQARINLRKYDILFNVLYETASDMLTMTGKVRDGLKKWIGYLAIGDPEQNIESLYKKIWHSLGSTNSSLVMEKLHTKAQQVIEINRIPVAREDIYNILRRFHWNINENNQQIEIGLDINVSNSNTNPEIHKFQFGERDLHDNILKLLLSLGTSSHEVSRQTLPNIGQVLINKLEPVDKLASELNRLAEPLYEASTYHNQPQMVSSFICFDSENIDSEARGYLDQLEKHMEVQNVYSNSVYGLIPSNNPYQLTIIRSDDILSPNDFAVWHKYLQAYIKLITDRGIAGANLHIFPAERNAVLYEREIYRTMQIPGYKILHPLVVALLDERVSIEYFFYCLSYGLITREQIGNQEIYMLNLPEKREPIYLSKSFNDLLVYRSPDILSVIDVFVNKKSDIENDQLVINMDDVSRAIKSRINEIGVEQAVSLLKFQLDNPDGIVKTLLQKAKNEQEVKPLEVKPLMSSEYEDLAAVAAVIIKGALSNLLGED